MADVVSYEQDSYRSNFTSYDQDSYKPPTPSLEPHRPEGYDSSYTKPPFTSFGATATGTKPLPFNLPDTMTMTTSDAQLEERRRAAIREREREAQAKERNRQLLAKRREDQLRHKSQVEHEAKQREVLMKENEERRIAQIEAARLANINEREEEERLREEERRRLAAVELRREQALQALEAQTLRAAEHQKRQREAILHKRQHAERVKDETQRLYEERLAEEQKRKADLVAVINRHREDKIASLEARKQSALLNQQEEELSQMVQLQATLSRLTARMHDIQVRREETRHKLLEARHLVEILLIDENDLTLAHEEVEADLVKLKAHEEGLARLVSTKYEHNEYNVAVVTIQRYYRGARDRVLVATMREAKEEQELQWAASNIQKVFRGKKQRDADKARREAELREMQQASVKMQAVFRGAQDRKLGREKRLQKEERERRQAMATKIQSWWRALQAKEMMGLLREMEALNLIKVKSQQMQGGRAAANGDARGPARGRKKLGAVGRNKSSSPGRGANNKQARRPTGSAGAQKKALMALQAQDYEQDSGMEWVAREQLRAEQRKLKLGMNMAGGGKGEMGRIYLNPTGPRKQGPRAKRMFVPLEATQRAAQVMAPAGPYTPYMPSPFQQTPTPAPHYHMPSQGVLMAQDFDHQQQMSARPPQAPSGGAPSHALARGGGGVGSGNPSFPELNREQGSNYTPRTSAYSPET